MNNFIVHIPVSQVCERFLQELIRSLGLKKKPQRASDNFLEDDGGDLFGDAAESEKSAPTQKDLHVQTSSPAAREDVLQTYNQLVDHMVPRLGRKPEIATPIRKGALTQLINLSCDRAQLENVTEIIKLYHDNESQKFVLEDTDAGDAFIS